MGGGGTSGGGARSTIGLAEAREAAGKVRADLRAGRDPVSYRKARRSTSDGIARDLPDCMSRLRAGSYGLADLALEF
jgi:hypothetical protein